MRIGLISDTHGLLRPSVFEHFSGVDHILHAGDVGDPDILTELEALAPVTAVYGNTDGADLRDRLSDVQEITLAEVEIVLLHGDQFGSPTPTSLASEYPDAGLIVYGHTHRPVVERIGELTIVNPGSAGPKRFNLPTTVALARIEPGAIRTNVVTL